MRQEGYYFVKLISGRWIMAEWFCVIGTEMYWQVMGSLDLFKDSDFDKIDETLITRNDDCPTIGRY